MRRNPRKVVARFETRPNDSRYVPSRLRWPVCSTAVLICGHRVNLGMGVDYRPASMACVQCGLAGEAREV